MNRIFKPVIQIRSERKQNPMVRKEPKATGPPNNHFKKKKKGKGGAAEYTGTELYKIIFPHQRHTQIFAPDLSSLPLVLCISSTLSLNSAFPQQFPRQCTILNGLLLPSRWIANNFQVRDFFKYCFMQSFLPLYQCVFFNFWSSHILVP